MSSSMDYASAQNSSGSGAKSERFTLLINDEANNDDHEIEFPGSKTVREVKEELYALTEIPVRFQLWTGWPTGVVDSTSLGDCGLDKPHSLTIKKQVNASSSSTDVNKLVRQLKLSQQKELTDVSETSLDVEDVTELFSEQDVFVLKVKQTPQKCLIPDNTPNEVEGTIQFSDNFSIRYGSCHPNFFHGTLEDAIKEVCFKRAIDKESLILCACKPAIQRKSLAIYLHHDSSVMSNIFCQQVLCNESIVSYLTNNYVVWGWDVTNESNRQKLLTAMNKNLGDPGVVTTRSIHPDLYPVIIIVSRVRSASKIYCVVRGSAIGTVDELMGILMEASKPSSDVEDLPKFYPEKHFFVPKVKPTAQKFLMPDNTPNEHIETMQFSDNFFIKIRYKSCHPMFFHGTLEDAVKEACFQPAEERKLLAIYLHHDGSCMADVFSQQVLCNESIVTYLTENYIVWGRDITNESNSEQLLTAVNKNFGGRKVVTARHMDLDLYPVLIIAWRDFGSATEISGALRSQTETVDQLMGILKYTSDS